METFELYVNKDAVKSQNLKREVIIAYNLLTSLPCSRTLLFCSALSASPSFPVGAPSLNL